MSINRVIRMLLLHDLVEIDVGDVPIHSENGTAHGSAEVLAAERAAANRIFGLLPDDLRDVLRALWEEFEAAETPDAVFAKSLDRVQPVMQNLASGGGTWKTYEVTAEQLSGADRAAWQAKRAELDERRERRTDRRRFRRDPDAYLNDLENKLDQSRLRT